jgi:hypothetical protein
MKKSDRFQNKLHPCASAAARREKSFLTPFLRKRRGNEMQWERRRSPPLTL